MTFTKDRCFFDTNILVYAHDRSSGEKHRVAQNMVREAWGNGTGLLSTQVLQEFYVTVTRKIPATLDGPNALRIVRALGEWDLHQVSLATICSAAELSDLHRFSFWDGLIVASASALRARYLLTEDMQHGFRVGDLELVNPYRR
jgi:predicted nucleic acid-binding protein